MDNKKKIELLKTIDLYIRGELSQTEIDDLWKEFLQHPEYYEWFETELHLRSLIKKGKKPVFFRDENGSARFYALGNYKTWLVAAAAAVLIAVGLQLFSIDQQEALQRMAVSTIEVSEMMGAELQRSDNETAEEMDIAINLALALAYDNEPELAIHQFRQILDQHPAGQQRVRVEMNLGILLYNQEEYEPAAAHFRSVTEMDEVQPRTLEKSWWFLGNAYLNLGELAEAREAVNHVYRMDGRFRSPALALLKRLDIELGNISSDEPATLER